MRGGYRAPAVDSGRHAAVFDHARSHSSRHACRSEFVFVNPNAKGTCGCGESFTTDLKNGGSAATPPVPPKAAPATGPPAAAETAQPAAPQ